MAGKYDHEESAKYENMTCVRRKYQYELTSCGLESGHGHGDRHETRHTALLAVFRYVVVGSAEEHVKIREKTAESTAKGGG